MQTEDTQGEEVVHSAFESLRRKIRRNFPKERTALHWKKITNHRIDSTCDRFTILRTGEGDAMRYTAKLKPNTVIGHRCLSPERAKEICEQHASPLPLESPAAGAASDTASDRGGEP